MDLLFQDALATGLALGAVAVIVRRVAGVFRPPRTFGASGCPSCGSCPAAPSAEPDAQAGAGDVVAHPVVLIRRGTPS